jgi:hypothetical protein
LPCEPATSETAPCLPGNQAPGILGRQRRCFIGSLPPFLLKPNAAKEAGDCQHEDEQGSQAELKSAGHLGIVADRRG